jgi:fucose permease
MNDKNKLGIFIRCCYGYAVSGMAVLVIGAILPYIIEEAGISFLAAGGILSVMAVGNLLASFLFPLLAAALGRKWAIFSMTMLTPFCILILSFLPPLPVMYGVMLVYGMVRGCITILNNAAVNDIYEKDAVGKLNILHCSFAIGAFLAPFLTARLMKMGLDWRTVLYLILFLTATSSIFYGTMNDTLLREKEESRKKAPNIKKGSDSGFEFLKSFGFYCIALILFFYLGVENCINGWFVTYLQNTGVMSDEYATTLVSLTWLVIMAGRLLCAVLSKRIAPPNMILINAIGSALCFFVLISTKNLSLVTIALLGFGFFLAGIYPTSIANAGPLIHGSTMGMSLLTAISALGGIITPQLVGGAADHIGIVAAISILVVNMVLVVLFSMINLRMKKKPHL